MGLHPVVTPFPSTVPCFQDTQRKGTRTTLLPYKLIEQSSKRRQDFGTTVYSTLCHSMHVAGQLIVFRELSRRCGIIMQTCRLWSGPASVALCLRSFRFPQKVCGVCRNHSWAYDNIPNDITSQEVVVRLQICMTSGQKWRCLRGFDVKLVFRATRMHVAQHIKALLADVKNFLLNRGRKHRSTTRHLLHLFLDPEQTNGPQRIAQPYTYS